RRGDHFVAGTTEHPRERIACVGLVLDEQKTPAHVASSGKRRTNDVDHDGCAVHPRSPFMARARARAIASPSPRPPGFFVESGSKSSRRTFGGMPGPSSL